MLRRRRLGISLLVLALTAGMVGPGGSAMAVPDTGAPAAAQATTADRAAGKAHTVTLLTGDRVTVFRDGRVGVQRGEGRESISFVTRRERGHVHVVPSDAVPLIQAGRLDARLFDVTALIDFGYHDARGDLPLILTKNPAARGAPAAAGAQGVTVVRELPAVDGLAVRAAKDDVPALWRSLTGGSRGARALGAGVTTVWLDGLRQPSLDVSVPQIGAPQAWRAGFDGAGVKVAVLDTGIDADHADLAGQVTAASNFTEGEEDDLDRVGHGTHVASTIAGTGAASNGKYTGVAPKAKLLDGKVCVEFGCAESWIIAGMEWAAEQGAQVINMSLGGWDGPEVDPLEQAVNDLTAEHGTLFVIAAGNSGADSTIGSPASADAALAVGAVDKNDELAEFSSRGPRIDGGLKPEITAPGVDIVAANSSDGFLGEPGEAYATLSGTSMATPHVAGAAAILAQRHPGIRPEALKSLLMGSAKPNPKLGAFAQGAGRVDVARAVNQSVSAQPPAVGFGRQMWPHNDDTPIIRTVAYRNTGTSPVTLALSVETTGPDGKPAQAGLFSLSATSVTIPAGGEASVTITADTRIGGKVDGFYTGRVVATGGSTTVTTPFAVDREVESYNVRLRHINRDGQPTQDFLSVLARSDRYGVVEFFGEDSTITVRVPKATYGLLSFVATGYEEEGDDGDTTLLAQPKVTVDKDLTLTVDARRGRPINVTVPRRDASMIMADVMAEVYGEGFGASFGTTGRPENPVYVGRLGPDRSYPWFRSEVTTTHTKVDAAGQAVVNSPFVYTGSWRSEGKMITGFTKRVRQSELATVRAKHARQGAAEAFKFTFPVHPRPSGASAIGVPIRTPFTSTEYYNTDRGVRWQPNMELIQVTEEGDEHVATLYGPTLRYRAGKTHTEQWNRGVFGPSLVDPVSPYEYLTRVGDTMIVIAPTHSDGESRAGFSVLSRGRLTVHRDGVKVAETDNAFAEVQVPAEAGRYRVEVEAERGAPAVLSTKTTTAWTFRSGHVDGEEPVRMPISVVRFAPDLSQHNTAPAGRAFSVPVMVERTPGSPAAANRSLKVEVSYDDGRTWTEARVTGSGNDRQVRLTHPDQAGFVSLRASATDRDGNTVEQTIIRAYQIVR